MDWESLAMARHWANGNSRWGNACAGPQSPLFAVRTTYLGGTAWAADMHEARGNC